jgi:hypothetical protein
MNDIVLKEYDRTIAHLKGIRRVVINNCFGGFGLSHEAILAYLDKCGVPVWTEANEKFGGLIEKVQKNLQTGMDDLDLLVGTRTNVIRRKLKSIEALSESDTKLILPEIQGIELEEE